MYCSGCGKEISEGSEFCSYCGAPQGATAQAGPPAGQPAAPPETASYAAAQAPAGAPPPPPGGPPAQPGPYAPPPKKKSALPWVLGILGVLVVAAVVLVLVFVVFEGDDSKKDSATGGKSTEETAENGSDKKDSTGKDSSDASGPEKVVKNFYKALEDRDVDMLLGTFEPSFRKELEEALGENQDRFFEMFFSYFPADMKVEIKKMETEIDGDSASVTIVEGTMSYTDENGEEVVEDATESEMEALLYRLSRRFSG